MSTGLLIGIIKACWKMKVEMKVHPLAYVTHELGC